MLVDGHVTLESLWDFHSRQIALTGEESEHAVACYACLGLLANCQISDTIDEARQLPLRRERR
jgi:hypothetical protein